MPPIIIASTKPRIGKTAFVASLSKILSTSNNIKIGVISNKENSNIDYENLKNLLSKNKKCELLKDFYKNKKLPSSISNKTKSIIEGTDNIKNNFDLAEETDGMIILIANYSDQIIKISKLYKDRLLGVIVNNVSKHRVWNIENQLAPSLSKNKINFLGWIPDDRALLAPRVNEVVSFLEGEYLTEEYNKENLLDNFLIGGLVLDWGPTYFSIHEKSGVIVRGDRPDVQLAALHTEKTKAVFLTKGMKPVEYVYYEADQSKIPLITVPGNTHDVVEKLEDLQQNIEFNHKEKLEYMVNLVEKNISIELISDALETTPTG